MRLFHYELIDADDLENNTEAGQTSHGPLGLGTVLPQEEQSGGHAQEIPVDDDRERSVLAGQIIKTEDRQRIQKEKRMVLQALDKEDESCEHYDPWRQHGIEKFHVNTSGPDHRFTARGRVKMNSEPTPAVLITSMFSP